MFVLHIVPNWLLSTTYDLIFALCTQLTPFKTSWPNFINVYPIDSFQDHMTWFLHGVPIFTHMDSFQDQCVPNWLLSRPYDLIFALCTQLTPFKTIWPNFINVYPIYSFQDHMTWFLHYVPNFINVYPTDSFQDHMTWFLHGVPIFINVYPIDSFQDHMTWFLHCVPNWLLSRPYDLNFVLCTQLTFRTIWPTFINMYPIDSFQDHMTWYLHCVPNWLLSRAFDIILSRCPQLTAFKIIWPDFYIVYLLLSMCTQLTPFNTIWLDFCSVYPVDSFQDHLI